MPDNQFVVCDELDLLWISGGFDMGKFLQGAGMYIGSFATGMVTLATSPTGIGLVAGVTLTTTMHTAGIMTIADAFRN